MSLLLHGGMLWAAVTIPLFLEPHPIRETRSAVQVVFPAVDGERREIARKTSSPERPTALLRKQRFLLPARQAAESKPPELAAPESGIQIEPRVSPPPVSLKKMNPPATVAKFRNGLPAEAQSSIKRARRQELAVRTGSFSNSLVSAERIDSRSASTQVGSFEFADPIGPADRASDSSKEAGFGGFAVRQAEAPEAEFSIADSGGFASESVVVVEQEGRGVARKAGFGAIEFGEVPEPSGRDFSSPQRRAWSPVEILAKPRPEYTESARERKVEGEVVLAVRFRADGAAEVVRILKRLGYGLDENAVRAAEAIRFKPARFEGQPVDSVVRLRVRFQLAY